MKRVLIKPPIMAITFSISSNAFVKGIMFDKRLTSAVETYGFLVDKGQSISLGDFADRITEFYDIETSDIYGFLKENQDVTVTPNI